MNKKGAEFEIDLLHIAAVLWRNVIAIILAVVIVGGACYAGSKAFITPKYTSQAYMFVNSANLSVGVARLSLNTSELALARNLVDTYMVILSSRQTLEEVIDRSGIDYTYEELLNTIECFPVENTAIFYVEVSTPDPAESELIANTIAAVLPEQIGAIIDGASARIVDYAVRATEISSPSYIGNALKGAVLAFIVACGIVVLRDLMDDKIHDSEFLTKTYDLPLLSAIPDLYSKQGKSYYYYKSSGKSTQK